MGTIKSLLTIRTKNSQQETYETASGDARIRAKELRKLGYLVAVGSMGIQVTPCGRLGCTLLTIMNPDDHIPTVPLIEWEA